MNNNVEGESDVHDDETNLENTQSDEIATDDGKEAVERDLSDEKAGEESKASQFESEYLSVDNDMPDDEAETIDDADDTEETDIVDEEEKPSLVEEKENPFNYEPVKNKLKAYKGRYKEAESRVKELEREVEKLKEKTSQEILNDNTYAPEMPEPHDYENWADFAKAQMQYQENKQKYERAKEQEIKERQSLLDKTLKNKKDYLNLTQNYHNKVEQFVTDTGMTIDQFREMASVLDEAFPSDSNEDIHPLVQVIMDSDVPGDLVYHLVTHDNDLDTIYEAYHKNPRKALLKIGKIEGEIANDRITPNEKPPRNKKIIPKIKGTSSDVSGNMSGSDKSMNQKFKEIVSQRKF